MDELHATLASLASFPEVICITESWFNNDIPNTAINIDKFVCFRMDRSLRSGGGVCTWCKYEQLPLRFFPKLHSPNDIEFVIIILQKSNSILLNVYIPPNLHADMKVEIIEFILNCIKEVLTQ